MKNFLDETGIAVLWDRIRTLVDTCAVSRCEFDNFKDGLCSNCIGNLTDGSADGSLRSINSAEEESGTYEIGANAVALGEDTKAIGEESFADGIGTVAEGRSAVVIGEYNALEATTPSADSRGEYAFVIGNGTSDANRSNAFAVKWDGTIELDDGNGGVVSMTPAQLTSLLALI